MFLSYPPVLNVAREWVSTISRLNLADSSCWHHLGLRGTQLSPSQNQSSAMTVLMSTRLSFPKARIFSSPFIRQTESRISGVRMLMSGNQNGGYLRSLIASPKLAFQECIHTCRCHATCSFSFPDSFIRMTFLAGGHSCMWVMVSQVFSTDSLKLYNLKWIELRTTGAEWVKYYLTACDYTNSWRFQRWCYPSS